MNNYLQHFGIIGMKWGVRRTPEQLGKPRSTKQQLKDEEKKEIARRAEISKARRTLSPDTIKKQVERLQMEKKLKDLTDADIAPGRKVVREVLATSGKATAITVTTAAAMFAVKKAIEAKWGPGAVSAVFPKKK